MLDATVLNSSNKGAVPGSACRDHSSKDEQALCSSLKPDLQDSAADTQFLPNVQAEAELKGHHQQWLHLQTLPDLASDFLMHKIFFKIL